MILFCDTSALIKLYIIEVGSDKLKARVLEAEAVAVCRIALAEAYAALFRRAREVPEDALVSGAFRKICDECANVVQRLAKQI